MCFVFSFIFIFRPFRCRCSLRFRFRVVSRLRFRFRSLFVISCFRFVFSLSPQLSFSFLVFSLVLVFVPCGVRGQVTQDNTASVTHSTYQTPILRRPVSITPSQSHRRLFFLFFVLPFGFEVNFRFLFRSHFFSQTGMLFFAFGVNFRF